MLIFSNVYLDIQQGRNICKSLWDFYKIIGHIEGVLNPAEDEVENEDDIDGDETANHENNTENHSRTLFAFPPELFVKSKVETEPDPAYDAGQL